MFDQFSKEQQHYLKEFLQTNEKSFKSISKKPAQPEKQEATNKIHGCEYDELSKEEKIKADLHGLESWNIISHHAEQKIFPTDGNIFRFKFYGIFYVAPAQNSLMLRMRIPGGKLLSYQAKGVADLSTKYADGIISITTRNNLQIRNIAPENALKILTELQQLGLTSKGSGADNIRNITASPTSGFDENEITDVLPLAVKMHYAIINTRTLYDLPRKFNIAFDSGSPASAACNTNDLAFTATTTTHPDYPGIYYRANIGGITGHKDFAKANDLLLTEQEVVPFAISLLEIYQQNGNRKNRKKARLKYLLDQWGHAKFIQTVCAHHQKPIATLDSSFDNPKPGKTNQAITGFQPQKDKTKMYAGVHIPVGNLTAAQLSELANLSETFGSSEMRLTVWQNIIIPNIKKRDTIDFEYALNKLDLTANPTTLSAGLIACTGSNGCKFANADTKGTALNIVEMLDKKWTIEEPINIHLTGCHHSCAQHYCGDIGLLATKLQVENNSVDAYQIYLGGGMDDKAKIAQELGITVATENIPETIETITSYYKNKKQTNESFNSFINRININELKQVLTGLTYA